MNPAKLFAIPLGLSILLGTTVSPTLAQSSRTTTQQVQQSNAVIPAQSAIVVAFPQELQIDAGREQEIPVTLVLAQPIYDSFGNVAVPANSAVAAKVISANGQAYVVVESLIIRGLVVPVQAVSSPLPGTTVTVSRGTDEAKRQAATLSSLAGSIIGAFGGDSDEIMQSGFIGNALGIVTGLSSPKQLRVVGIPQGSTHVLTLQDSVSY